MTDETGSQPMVDALQGLADRARARAEHYERTGLPSPFLCCTICGSVITREARETHTAWHERKETT